MNSNQLPLSRLVTNVPSLNHRKKKKAETADSAKACSKP